MTEREVRELRWMSRHCKTQVDNQKNGSKTETGIFLFWGTSFTM